jgi:prolyl-tRNA synthetase
MTTRLIGAVIMVHGDDSGLVLPPNVAPYQVVIVPIPRGNWEETVLPRARAIEADLAAAGIRVKLDARDVYTPGWKYAEWELRGVPLRLEIGPKDIEKGQVVLARRDTREKQSMAMDGLTLGVRTLLEEIQQAMYARALRFREEHTTRVASYAEFTRVMEGRPGFVIAGWCGSDACEAQIKAETQATLRNIPFDSPDAGARSGQAGAAASTCVKCGRPAVAEPWFAKAY